MTTEKHLIIRDPGFITPGVTPAIENIPAHAAVATGVPGRLRGRGTVVDYPELTLVVGADYNLIQFRIIIDRIGMNPINSTERLGEIDIHQFRMFSHHTIVVLG